MATANRAGATNVHDAVGSGDRHDARLRRAAQARLRGLDQPRAPAALDARPGRLDHARLRDRSPPGRGVALRLAPFRRQPRWRCAACTRRSSPPERLVSTESWGGDWPETLNTLVLSEEDGKTTITQHGALPVEGGSRRGAQDGDEGRHVRELRSSRRVPANDGMRRTVRPRSAVSGAIPPSPDGIPRSPRRIPHGKSLATGS